MVNKKVSPYSCGKNHESKNETVCHYLPSFALAASARAVKAAASLTAKSASISQFQTMHQL